MKPDSLSTIPNTYMVGRENRLLQGLFCLTFINYLSMCVKRLLRGSSEWADMRCCIIPKLRFVLLLPDAEHIVSCVEKDLLC